MEKRSDSSLKKAVYGHIERVTPGSPADKAGVMAGDSLISINGEELRDVIDYYHAISASGTLSYKVKRRGSDLSLDIEPRGGSPVGIFFSEPVFDGVRNCNNSCMFCFVDQLPKGLREALYSKDDDYRLSFLWGNFITLTNISQSDIDRIVDQHISPIYVSLHATDSEVRCTLFGRKGTEEALGFLGQLLENNIEVHLQVVIVPGINDKLTLQKTLSDVGEYFAAATSIALVPIGMSVIGLERLGESILFTREDAAEALEIGEEWRKAFMLSGGPDLQMSDEIYFLLASGVPDSDYYRGYPQLQNGVGMVRKFVEEAQSVSINRGGSDGETVILTTEMGLWGLSHLERYLSHFNSITIKNSLFGPTVNVCGLMTGQDLIDTIRGVGSSKKFLLPEVCLKGDQLIDGVSMDDVMRETGAQLEIVPPSGDALVNAVLQS